MAAAILIVVLLGWLAIDQLLSSKES